MSSSPKKIKEIIKRDQKQRRRRRREAAVPKAELVRVRRAVEEPTAELTVNVIKAALSKGYRGQMTAEVSTARLTAECWRWL